MEISQEMTLLSESGYCMPFHDHDEDVEMTLMYGEQKHPTTGENFFHHGVDIKAHYYMLAALADGKVTGIGNDPKHGLYVIVLYDGKYSVKYAHLSGVHASFGQQVKAGTIVGVSGKDILHLEVRYMDEEINPAEFLAMLYANFKSYYANLKEGETPEFVNLDMDVKTKYDDDQEEIQGLMLKFFIPYLKDLLAGVYQGGPHTAQSLRNLFTIGCNKHYFLDTIPSIPNPAGLTQRSSSLVGKVQDVLIGDFLSYLAVRHNCYLSSFTDSQKKKLESDAIAEKGIIDPLADFDIDIQSFDIPRLISVYSDQGGINWWTKAWFNNREDGEAAVEISKQVALSFWRDEIEKDAMLEEYFPKQMQAYHQAIEQTRQQLSQQMIEMKQQETLQYNL